MSNASCFCFSIFEFHSRRQHKQHQPSCSAEREIDAKFKRDECVQKIMQSNIHNCNQFESFEIAIKHKEKEWKKNWNRNDQALSIG